jgi:tetratricopeptide (TPR) repeat protein
MTQFLLAIILVFAAPAAAPAIDGPKAYQMASDLHAKGQFKEAIAAYQQALAAGHLPGLASYNIACAYAKLGDKDAAFLWLDKTTRTGWRLLDQMKGDADLAPLHADPRWAKTIDTMDAAQFPCKHDSKNRQFDFWIGDWNVVDASGNNLGESHVELMLDSCVIYENWTGRLGGDGKSFNLWDAGRKKWLQTWVDNGGQLHRYEGDFTDGAMRYRGETFGRNGQATQLRMTFTPLPGGKVRQLMESSSDGKSWSTGFDGIYVKKGG